MAITKIIELEGTSDRSWEDAVKMAIQEAGKTLKNITMVSVDNLAAEVEDGKITTYTANIRLAFSVEDGMRHHHG